MDTPENTNQNGNRPENLPLAEPVYGQTKILSAPLNSATLKSFFQVTGGSSLYCLSAVFIAYGIVMILRPVLESSSTFRDALPCLLTLHVYELALLGVLLLIVFKKVVDDAVSLAILMALFLVGTSIALGSVANRGITMSLYVGLFGIIIGFVKIYSMRRFARIPFKILSIIGIIAILAYNYLGPALMARSVSANPTDESTRRGFWLLLYLFMLGASAIVWIEAVLGEVTEQTAKKIPFLQSPVMVYLLGTIIVAASGVHHYTMAYAFTLERVLLDYVPVVTVICLLIIEILRYADKRLDIAEAGICCIPLALTLFAIYHKSVLSSSEPSIGLICYPPVMLGAIGIIIAALAVYRKCRVLWFPVFAYGLGVVLTFGFSPEYPHELNTFACAAILISVLLVYGLIRWNPYYCLAGIILLGMGLPTLDKFADVTKSWDLSELGTVAGVYGLGTIILCLLFAKRLHVMVRIAGAICLAGFVFDFLPSSAHWRDVIVAVMLALLIVALWIRSKDVVIIAILSLPIFIRAYILTKLLAAWRYVILGFVLLGVGTLVSLFKRSSEKNTMPENEGYSSDR